MGSNLFILLTLLAQNTLSCKGQMVETKNGAIIFSVPGASMILNATESCGGGASGPMSFASMQDLHYSQNFTFGALLPQVISFYYISLTIKSTSGSRE